MCSEARGSRNPRAWAHLGSPPVAHRQPPGPSASLPDLRTATATHQDTPPPQTARSAQYLQTLCSLSRSPGAPHRQTQAGLKFSRARAERTVPPGLKCPGPAASALGLHLKFRRQSGRRKHLSFSVACVSSVSRGLLPPAFHASQGGQIIPQRASCQSPRAFSRAESFDSRQCWFAGTSLLGPRVQIECPFERARGDPVPLLLRLRDTRSRPSCRALGGRPLPHPRGTGP